MDTPASDRLPRTIAAIQEGMTDGLHIGAQLYVSIAGEVIADAAWGAARAGVPMSTDTLMLWLSSAKPVAAVAIGQLWERGQIDLDDPVVKHIPEFAAGGKEGITIRHLLKHTGGFRGAALNWSYAPWEDIVAEVCAGRLETGWTPGRKAGYHTAGSWIILGEILRRLDGRPFEQYVREEIFLPLGMSDTWIGMPAKEYRACGNRIGLMHSTTGDAPMPAFQADTEAGCGVCRPGSNGRGPIRELGYFYEMILGKGQRRGNRVISPQTAEAMTARHRAGMFDHTFGRVMDWGLGFIVNNNIHGVETVSYSFGRHASARAVGHGGYQSSVGFADPEHALAVALVFNGCPGDMKHGQRMRLATAAIYDDLRLAS